AGSRWGARRVRRYSTARRGGAWARGRGRCPRSPAAPPLPSGFRSAADGTGSALARGDEAVAAQGRPAGNPGLVLLQLRRSAGPRGGVHARAEVGPVHVVVVAGLEDLPAPLAVPHLRGVEVRCGGGARPACAV